MPVKIKHLGLQDYQSTWQAMQDFTNQRTAETVDEIWVVEHPPVFTQGLNGKAEHILQQPDIPIVKTDRGGQITYHAPGQLVLYTLIDLKKTKLGVRALVSIIENSIIAYLANFDISAEARKDAPGVYVAGNKIASLGLKIRKQRSYHGLALNIDMDLSPFKLVNPCGLQGMQMTQMKAFINPPPSIEAAGQALAEIIQSQINAHQFT